MELLQKTNTFSVLTPNKKEPMKPVEKVKLVPKYDIITNPIEPASKELVDYDPSISSHTVIYPNKPLKYLDNILINTLWGDIKGLITNQVDLINYIKNNLGSIWGKITGDILLLKDLIEYILNSISTREIKWGDIKGTIEDQIDLQNKFIEILNQIEQIDNKMNSLDLKSNTEKVDISKTIQINGGPLATNEVKQLFPNGITSEMNLHLVLNTLFCKAINPNITKPSIKFNNTYLEYEIGTKVTPSYTITFNPGLYLFGPSTGVLAENYKVIFINDEKNTPNGTFNSFNINYQSYLMKAEATYLDSTTNPKNNIGEEIPELKIKAGTASASKTYKGFRYIFAGSFMDKSKILVTSDEIRSLENKYKEGISTFQVKAKEGCLRICFAIPGSGINCEILNPDGFPATSAFTHYELLVTGANKLFPTIYTIYLTDVAKPYPKTENYKVTIKK